MTSHEPGSGGGGIRVRFAPSPTGFLHVGGGRTALFNWLFARRHGGTFVLRIEDTDLERSTEASVRTILDGLAWLGITWDEGPFFQARNIEAHRALARRLLAEGKAYHCFCSVEDLDRKRAAAEKAGSAWKYDRACLRLAPDETRRRLAAGEPAAVRFRVPDGPVAWEDLVHGATSFESGVIEDIVLLRSDGTPTYNLSCVADDIEMRITHVIRGDDHISNTPKQILLYRAAGAEPPRFAHLPLILGADKKRLSKRHGAVSVTEYRDRGYLPEALFNFLALLGWSPGDGREKMTKEEMIAVFTLEAINRKGAVFDEQKLEWINSQYINDLPSATIAGIVRPDLEALGLWSADLDPGGARREWFLRVLEALKARSKRLTDFARDVGPFLTERFEYRPDAVEKYLKPSPKTGGPGEIAARLLLLRESLARVEPFDETHTEAALRGLAEGRGEPAAHFIHPLRIALVGTAVSPGIFTILVLVGKERSLARLDRLAAFLT
ncbi:MAG TPA: glutamate--tRNA ligase [Candidatus Polarisedimenticolia bacterium]|nr:glutamate--tRNA ligase [Candidatus Polarisedimenticolia bacterium]